MGGGAGPGTRFTTSRLLTAASRLLTAAFSHLKLGYFMDERGALGGIDVRVKKTRGCQGSGSAARHRFFGTYFYFNEGLFSRVAVSISAFDKS